MSAILRSLTLLGASNEAPAVCRLVIALLLVAVSTTGAAADDAADAHRLLKAHAEYLCSDALEGRGFGNKGLDLAATYLADQFRQYGLKTDSYKGTPFQEFDGAMTVELGPRNQLSLLGPGSDSAKRDRIKLAFGFDYLPLTVTFRSRNLFPRICCCLEQKSKLEYASRICPKEKGRRRTYEG
jgi:hypothetical protein